MTKKEVRDVLNNPRANFQYVIGLLTRYFLENPVKSIMINSIVSSAKGKKRFNTLDLFRFFYEYGKDVVENTLISRGEYSNKMLLKSVWENAHIQNIVISQIKKGYVMFPVTEEDFKNIKEGQRKERLKRQAELMRIAKAKKRLEKLSVEKGVDSLQDSPEKRVDSLQDSPVKSVSKKFTKEQLEQISLLRRMRT